VADLLALWRFCIGEGLDDGAAADAVLAADRPFGHAVGVSRRMAAGQDREPLIRGIRCGSNPRHPSTPPSRAPSDGPTLLTKPENGPTSLTKSELNCHRTVGRGPEVVHAEFLCVSFDRGLSGRRGRCPSPLSRATSHWFRPMMAVVSPNPAREPG
jgi:hypothetical protein